MYYGNVTFMLSYPRSRSAWLCEFLRPVATTLHDPLKQCASIDELGTHVIDEHLKSRPHHPVFVADTAAVFFHREIAARFPGARYLFVLRAFDDVMRSVHALGLPTENLGAARKALNDAFDTVLGDHGRYTVVVDYQHLNEQLHSVWRFVGGLAPLNDSYAQRLIATNIQVPVREQNRLTDLTKMQQLFDTRRTPA